MSASDRAFGFRRLQDSPGLGGAKRFHALGDFRITAGQNLRGEQAGVFRPPDRHGSDRNTARHLHNRQERIESAEIFGWNRHADDGEMCFRRQHTRQMSRPTGSGDDDFDPSGWRLLRVRK